VSLHSVTVSWESKEGYAKPIANNKIYPEKPTPNGNVENQLYLKCTINPAIPQGRSGTVHYKILDPKNAVPEITANNNGSISPGSGTNTFLAGQTQYKELLTINDAYAGDNYLGTAHPRGEVEIVLAEDKKTAIVSDNGENKTPPQTAILTVWRTLWCELDDMVAANTVVNQMPNYPISATVWNVFTDQGQMPELVNPVASGDSYIFNWSPHTIGNDDPSKPDISLLAANLQVVCVEAKELTANFNERTQIWFLSWVLGGSLEKMATISVNYKGGGNTANHKDFWKIHIVGTFADAKNITLKGYATSPANGESAFIFNKRIEHAIGVPRRLSDIAANIGEYTVPGALTNPETNNTFAEDLTCDQNSNPPVYVTAKADLKARLTYHESMHLLDHADFGVGIMDYFILEFLPGDYIKLVPSQIQTIQKLEKPKYGGNN
jgi:hypothetical protein